MLEFDVFYICSLQIPLYPLLTAMDISQMIFLLLLVRLKSEVGVRDFILLTCGFPSLHHKIKYLSLKAVVAGAARAPALLLLFILIAVMHGCQCSAVLCSA